MTYDNFVKLVEKMRYAQKTYFATRSQNWLTDSKKLERQVDNAIASKDIGQDLFDGMENDDEQVQRN